MRTFHLLILAGSILGAAWILKPVPVEQVSEVELQRREDTERRFQRMLEEDKMNRCLVSIGKTIQTLDRNDPQQETPYRKCMWPDDPRGWLRRTWDRTWAVFR